MANILRKTFFLDTNILHFATPIYHYTSPEGLEGILTSNSLHFTNIYFLNDKSEMIYTHELLKKILPDLQNEINPELLQEINKRADYVTCSNYYNEESEVLFREDFYIASFSTDSDNLALWNNYTKNDNKIGYNIAFDVLKLIEFVKFFDEEKIFEGSLVCYDPDKQKNLITEQIREANIYYTEENKQGILKELFENFITDSLFFKHPSFAIENEFRIIWSNLSHIGDKNLNFKIRGGLYVPYKQLPLPKRGIFKKPDDVINEIGVSPTAPKELLQYSLKKLLNKTNHHFLKIRYSDIPLRF